MPAALKLAIPLLFLARLAAAAEPRVEGSSFPVTDVGPGRTEPLSKDFPSAGLKAVELRVSAGILAVARADADRVSVVVTPKRLAKACAVTVEAAGDRVVVHVRERRKNYYGFSWGKDSCEADVAVRMPARLELDSAAGSGALAANGLGSIKHRSGSGGLRLEGCEGPIDASIGSGSVEGRGLRRGARVKTGSGSVKLSWSRAPSSGEIEVKTGSGAVELLFPQGTRAGVSMKAGSGSRSSAIQDDAGAPLRISVKTGSGSINISEDRGR